MATPIDHEELAISRLVSQFREATTLIAYIQALLSEANTLEEVGHSLITGRSLDGAVGVQLDILGEIVGQPRVLIDATTTPYFGFQGAPNAQSFGDINDPTVGGRFRSVDEQATGYRTLSDEEYRFYIKARIIANHTSARPEDIIAQFKFLFGDYPVTLVENPGGDVAEYTVEFGRDLTPTEEALLLSTDIVPKPSGVAVAYIV